MISKFILIVLFVLYGAISVYNIVKTTKENGFFIDDKQCRSVYYCNLINSSLGTLISVFFVVFLILQTICKNILMCNISFSLTKFIIVVIFVGINSWNFYELIQDDFCYEKYKIKAINIGFLSILGTTLLTLIIDCIFCDKKPRDNNDDYKSMN